MNDWQLLTRYTEGDSAALETLIRRHIDFVFASATRLANASDAPNVGQAVFILLARKARHIPHRGTLIGWLYQTTRHCAANLRRIQNRRRRHEREAAMSRPDSVIPPAPNELPVLLENALAKLAAPDRDILLLHFLDNKTYAEVAAELDTTEEAARKRATRALEKLRLALVRNAQFSLAALTPFLSTQAEITAPHSLLTTLVAFVHGTPMSAAATSLADAVSRTLQLAKLQLASLVVAALLLLATTTFILSSKIHPPETLQSDAAATPIAHYATIPAPPFRPLSPATVGPIQMVKWSVVLRTSAADRIKKLCSPVDAPKTSWYAAMQGDGEALFKTIHDALAINDAILEHPGGYQLKFASHSGDHSVAYAVSNIYFHGPAYIFTQPPDQLAIRFEGYGRGAFVPSRTGITLSLDLPTLQCMLLRTNSRGNMLGRLPGVPILHPAIVYTGDLAPGQALAFLGNFAQAGHPELSELVVWQTFRAPNAAMPLFESIRSPVEWFDRGGALATLAAFRRSQNWNVRAAAKAADPNPKWTRTLNDGRIITLVAVGRPQTFPACWWNPDGQPIQGVDHWSNLTRGQGKPLAAVILINDPAKPPLPPGNMHAADNVYTDSQGTSATYGCDEDDASITVNIGSGSWQHFGSFTNKQRITVNGIRLTPTIQDDSDDPPAITSVHFDKMVPDTEFAVQLIDKAGKSFGELSASSLIEIVDERSPYQSEFFLPFKNVASASLCYRSRELIMFNSFAKDPLTPPQPPECDPAPINAMAEINAFTFDLIDAANTGDVAKLRPFFAATTDAEKQTADAEAEGFIAIAQLEHAAETHYGKTAAQYALRSSGVTPLEFDLAADWEIHPVEAHALSNGHIKLIRQNNHWLLPVETRFSSIKKPSPLIRILQSLRHDLDVGKYPTPEAFSAAMRAGINALIPQSR